MDQVTNGKQYDKLSLALLGAGAASFVALIVLLALIFFTDTFDSNGGNSLEGTVTAFEVTPGPTVTPQEIPPSRAPIARILIPDYEVDAPVQTKGIDANNVMEAPDGPENVAWYDFTAHPGFGSNAVFSGHVDYIDYGPAVFANLRNLEPNAVIDVVLEDGTRYRYKVSSKELVPADTDVSGIVGPTESEMITLITCDGTFNASSGQYTDRLIVQASLARMFPPGASASAE
jgi:LPXTG-site transpeptidase (sortase) family protein